MLIVIRVCCNTNGKWRRLIWQWDFQHSFCAAGPYYNLVWASRYASGCVSLRVGFADVGGVWGHDRVLWDENLLILLLRHRGKYGRVSCETTPATRRRPWLCWSKWKRTAMIRDFGREKLGCRRFVFQDQLWYTTRDLGEADSLPSLPLTSWGQTKPRWIRELITQKCTIQWFSRYRNSVIQRNLVAVNPLHVTFVKNYSTYFETNTHRFLEEMPHILDSRPTDGGED
jgi:hypothetical protein